MQTAAVLVFCTSFAAVVYAYAGYPLLVWTLARWFGGPSRPSPGTVPADRLPRVSILVAAYNEEAVIEGRIQNALALDYPPDKLEIVIASDGSSDATCEIVHRYADRGVRLLDYRERRGKSTVLNASVRELNGDVIVLSDANTNFEPDAIRRLIRWFADPRIGAVCGRLVLTDPETGRNVDSLYWRYETFLKSCEGRLGALLGANGAIYAIRRQLYVPVPDNTIVDDFVIPLLARLRHGCAIVYDCDAVAHEETPPAIRSEFRRRSRIGAGGYQSIGLLWRLLHPRHGWVAFSFFSHKLLRWFAPFLLVAMLASNLLLLEQRFYQLILGGQAAFYLVSAGGVLLSGSDRLSRLVRTTTMFSSMNAALMVGFWRWLLTTQRGDWQRTAR